MEDLVVIEDFMGSVVAHVVAKNVRAVMMLNPCVIGCKLILDTGAEIPLPGVHAHDAVKQLWPKTDAASPK